ncbi:MAG: glycosyltransferase [Verrucomicrobiaceae bacterium]|nr:MAG: glycosyltransferase [Verrucomicrobiaceae bacterium]
MRSPRLSELPPPPTGKTGWPWTVESEPVPELSCGHECPKITVVTPSYMQGGYLEETIRSVLLQGYPNLEYFVLDGGSRDNSAEIIRRYEPWLAGWRCEKDEGQAATINEGWARASGDVVAWINSDDWYQVNAFAAVAPQFVGQTPAHWIQGAVDDHSSEGQFLRRRSAAATPLAKAIGFRDFGYHQPGMFWGRELITKVGSLDTTFDCSFDLEFWARSLAHGFELKPLEQAVACFRQHADAKTCRRTELIMRENWAVFRRYASDLSPAERRQAACWLRDYEADTLPRVLYRRLQQGERGVAFSYLLRKWRVALHLQPPRLALGALWRILVTGRAPSWFVD